VLFVLRHSSYESTTDYGILDSGSITQINDASVAHDRVVFVQLMVYYLVDPESVNYKCYALMWCISPFYFQCCLYSLNFCSFIFSRSIISLFIHSLLYEVLFRCCHLI
jgi:hypothetical protein